MNTALSLEGMSPPESNGVASWRRFLVEKRAGAGAVSVGEYCAELVELWTSTGRPASSIRSLRSAITHQIAPAFGPMPVADLRPEYVGAWIQAMLAEGKARKTVRKVVSFLSSALYLAVRAGGVEVNAVDLLPPGELPANRAADPTRTALEALSFAQAVDLIRAQNRLVEQQWIAWCVLLLTGARFGEMAALRWGDVSLGHSLRIERSWDGKARVEAPTKTGIVRHVPISRHLEAVLAVSAELSRLQLGRELHDRDLVAPYFERGQPRQWANTTANRRWKEDQAVLGWPMPPTGPRTVKATRHSFTTLARRAGGDIAAVHMITHASEPDSRTSARVYTHLDFEDLRGAVDHLDARLSEEMERHDAK